MVEIPRGRSRREHALELQALFGFKAFTMRHYREGVRSLEDVAWQTDKGIVLASALVDEYRRRQVLLPTLNNIERICAEAITRANRRIYAALTGSLTNVHRLRLDALLRLRDHGNTTLLGWLRQSPARVNSRHMLEHIERLCTLQALDLPNGIERQIHQNRMLKIAREGGQMTPADLAKFEPQRRYATLVAVAVEGTATVTDEIIDLHDRITGKMFNAAKHKHQEQFQTSGKAINDKVRLYGRVGQALIKAKQLGADPFAAIESVLPWEAFTSSVSEAQKLAQPEDFDFLHRIGESYATLRRYAPEFLEVLKFRAAPAAEGVLEAIGVLRVMNAENARKIPMDAPIDFIKKRWEKLVLTEDGVDRRYYELCAMSELNNALRSGDVWVEGSRQHKDFDEYLVPTAKFATLKTAGKLPLSVATGCEEYLHERLSLLEQQLETVNMLASANQLPDASITDAGLKITPLDSAVPEAAQQMIDQTAMMLPHVKIASFPDQVIVARFTASRARALTLRAGLRSAHPTAKVAAISRLGIELRGQAPGFVLRRTLDWVEARGEQWKYPELWDSAGKRRPFAKQVLYGNEAGGRGMYFATRMEARAQGGKVQARDGEIVIEGAQELTLILSAATSYNGFEKSPSKQGIDPSAQAARFHARAVSQTDESLRRRHVKDYQSLFERVTVNLSSAKASTEASRRPTDQRIARFHEGEDPAFAALYLQFARYLTIAGSRPGSQPLNLQGIWNREVIPPWACGYTTNINLQMNYWPVDILNLSECFEPLERLITEAAFTGSATAHSMYKRRGWVMHHNTSLWRGTQPVDNNAMPAFWPLGAAWLCQHLWEHYLITDDQAFLRRTYSLIKGAAEFLLDWLVEGQDGHLLTPAGVSPENLFTYSAHDGKERSAGVSRGPTMDIAITRQVFRNCIAAGETLGIDQDFRATLSTRIEKLLPYKIGSRGQLQEWPIDFEEAQKNHRHVSHLYGLYPDNQITPQTPELMSAVHRSLELRGDEGTGWSRAWKVCLWARLQDGNHAYRLVDNLFTPAKNGTVDSEQGGLMTNMFCSCPPMQIDGNFGGAAGIVEMLLQSQSGIVHLLPALPDAWSDGLFIGFRTRANCEVSAKWASGKLLWAEFLSPAARTIDVLYAEKKRTIELEPRKRLVMSTDS